MFYELALRHSTRKPIVQLCQRAADKLPFDVGQVRTIVVDTADIYTLVPQLESLKAQIAAQIRKTLDEQAEVENPLKRDLRPISGMSFRGRRAAELVHGAAGHSNLALASARMRCSARMERHRLTSSARVLTGGVARARNTALRAVVEPSRGAAGTLQPQKQRGRWECWRLSALRY